MLNLEAKTKPQELILAYLNENATDALIEKINNGVQIEKDGKQLISKKNLDGFMSYANGEARKLAEKGANSACVEDAVVFGWAMHYFEEDSIEGTLYNPDGTPYAPPKPAKKETRKTITEKPVVVPKKEEPQQRQASLFDMLEVAEPPKEEPKPVVEEQKPTIDEILDYNIDEDHDNDEDDDEDDEQPTEEEIQEILREIHEEEQKPSPSPLYARYLDLEKKYPSAFVLMRLGDFYEAFGQTAITLAEEMNLTLTGRDCGLEERIPMIGFPYHAADTYFLKIHAKHDMLVWEKEDEETFLPKKEPKQNDGKHWLDENTYVDEDGVMHEVNKAVPDWLDRLFNGKIIMR